MIVELEGVMFQPTERIICQSVDIIGRNLMIDGKIVARRDNFSGDYWYRFPEPQCFPKLIVNIRIREDQ